MNLDKLGFKTLFSLYLESNSIDERKNIYQALLKVNKIVEEDLLEIIKYCSLYNRSYLQIKSSSDHTLFNSDYLNNLKIIINVFIEVLHKIDSKQEYITEDNNEYDYFDIIIYYLKQSKDYDILFNRTYEVFNLCVWNDLKVFYKVLYVFLTDEVFYKLKTNIIYEMFLFKNMLFNYLSKSNSNIELIMKQINSNDYSLDITPSDNFIKLKELIEIRSVCSDKSLTFFADGYKMMSLYRANNLFDYSAVCLQFFKVIEIELKEKIINHCSYDLNKENLFLGLEYLNLTVYHQDFLTKIELGKIRNILRKIKTIMYDIRNEKEVEFFNEDIKIFYTRLIALFINVKTINFYLDIISHRVVDLYRNSAVHTGIVSYERAVEALNITTIFLKNVSQLNYSFKLSNVINLKHQDTPDFILELVKE